MGLIRSITLWAAVFLSLVGIVAMSLYVVRHPTMRPLLRPEPPAPVTAVALSLPAPVPSATRAPPSATPLPATATAVPLAPSPGPTASATLAVPTATPAAPSATATPAPPTPVVVGERSYTVLLPAAVKDGQRFPYSCEFDAAWVILQSYGVNVSVDELIERMPKDTSVEPYLVEGSDGFVIYGGDIRRFYSGDYTKNFLARSTGAAMQQLFAAYGVESQAVRSREEVEAALLRGELIWMKTTVDFKPWRPATWIMPDGSQLKTVLGNDHAVVAIGFNDEVVVIRDVLGPTSTGRNRPLEYEVRWESFMAAWGAQDYDGLAIARPVS